MSSKLESASQTARQKWANFGSLISGQFVKIQLLLKLHWKFDTALKESFRPGGKSKAKTLQECKYADVARIRVLHIFFVFLLFLL